MVSFTIRLITDSIVVITNKNFTTTVSMHHSILPDLDLSHYSGIFNLLQLQENLSHLQHRTVKNLRGLGYAGHGRHQQGTTGLDYSDIVVLDGPATPVALELALMSIQKSVTHHIIVTSSLVLNNKNLRITNITYNPTAKDSMIRTYTCS